MEATIKSFLDYLEKDKKYSPNTRLSYQGDLTQFNSFASASNARAGESLDFVANKEVLARYLQSLNDKGYSVSTVARKIASVKSFIRYLVATGRLRDDSAPSISSPQVNKPLPKTLTIAEVRSVLAEPAKSTAIEAKRDRAMLELLYATGLRATELMNLDIGDVNLEKCTVNCHGNMNRTRVISIDEYIARILREYIKESRIKLTNNQNEPALFLNMRGERLTRQGFWQIIQGYAEKVGLGKKVTPRSLRHSFAIHRLKNGEDLHTMQELLGHAHISTTKVYKDVGAR
jgi:integrase/recombinase XerD